MEFSPHQIVFYGLYLVSIASFSALFTVRWPKTIYAQWEKESHAFFKYTNTEDKSSPTLLSRSKCTSCNTTLSWIDNIPLFSYWLLKGKCRHCHEKISARYWLIELAIPLTCIPLLLCTDNLIDLCLQTMVLSTIMTAAIIDYEHKLIPDECSGLVICVVLLGNINSPLLASSVLGLLCGYGLIYLLRAYYLAAKKVEVIGLGDAKLLAALGAWLYIDNLLIVLFCASVLGILYTQTLPYIFSSINKSRYIPFGPFLVASSIGIFYIEHL